MALVSKKHNFIFIHIFRCGGNSVRRMIGAPSVGDHTDRLGGEEVLGVHVDMKDVKTYFYKKNEQVFFDNAFKFTFVRNPFSWMVSVYEYIRRHPGHNFQKTVAPMTFVQFLNWYVWTAMEFNKPFGANKYMHLHDFIYDVNGNVAIDFTGTLENLRQDMLLVKNMTGVRLGEYVKINGRPVGKPWRDFYSKESIAIVKEHFAKDFELFGYLW